MAKTIASLVDGRVVPWFSQDDPIPNDYVVIPDSLLAEWNEGKITDGITLAKTALAGNATVGTGKPRKSVIRDGGDTASESRHL